MVLYFSGHGILDDQGRLYLAVKDTDQAADGEQFGHIFIVKRHSGNQDELFYQSSAAGWFNNWYKLELVIDPETMEVTCLVDGAAIGTYLPENASILRDADFTRTLVNLR